MLALVAYCRLWFWVTADNLSAWSRGPIATKRKRAQQFAAKHLDVY